MNTQAILSQDLTWRKVWRVGANVDTDALAPGAYMKHGLEVIALHCLEALRPDFAKGVQAGDVLVAGPDFGIGSSREQAAGVLKHLGIAAVIAPSYSGLFFRNSFNLGLLLLTCEEAEILQENELDATKIVDGTKWRTFFELLHNTRHAKEVF